jgi:hypothetical protein
MTVLDHPHPVDPERVAHARDRVLAAEDASRLSGLLSLRWFSALRASRSPTQVPRGK